MIDIVKVEKRWQQSYIIERRDGEINILKKKYIKGEGEIWQEVDVDSAEGQAALHALEEQEKKDFIEN